MMDKPFKHQKYDEALGDYIICGDIVNGICQNCGSDFSERIAKNDFQDNEPEEESDEDDDYGPMGEDTAPCDFQCRPLEFFIIIDKCTPS